VGQHMVEQLDYNIKLLEKREDGCNYKIDVTIPMSFGWIDDVYYCVQNDVFNNCFKINHNYNDQENVHFQSEVFLKTSAIYRTYFTFTANGKRLYLFKDGKILDYPDNNSLDKISVNFDTPEWAKGAMMYHIFVDRFNRGSKEKLKPIGKRNVHKSFNEPFKDGPDKNGNWNVDFYGGDLLGIVDKLDYIASLGTDIIYLSPIVESQSNHRYDTADYENVDPYVGTNEDLKLLCDEAHKRGMKIVLDAVFNHTGDDSKYFNRYFTYDSQGAKQDPNGYYGTFYKKTIKDNELQFWYWWGFENLPVCDGTSKTWQDYIYGENGIIDKWFNLGIDGLRLDVADELSDKFIEGIRKAVKRNKEDGLIIGEVWKNAMRMNRTYISSGKGMDSHMDYPLVDALIRYFKYTDTDKLRYIIQDMLNEYPKGSIETMMNFTSTHDISRPIDIFGSKEFDYYKEWAWDILHERNKEEDYKYFNDFKMTKEEIKKGKELFKTYLFCLNFMPGILSIFYGDEAGVLGLGNILNRQPYPWGKEDRDLVGFVKMLGSIRKEEKFLKKADMEIVAITPDYFMFERTSNEGDALITVNRTEDKKKIIIPSKYETPNTMYTLNNSHKKILTPYGGNAIIKR